MSHTPGLMVWIIVSMFESYDLEVVLTINPSEGVLVDQPVTFTCIFNSNATGVRFIQNENKELCALEEKGGMCSNSSCSSGETVMCINSTTYIVQLKARLEWDEQIFTCESVKFEVRSNDVNITMSVPVSRVVISPSSVSIDEGQQQSITCQTSYCKPQATVSWYKDGVDITSNSTSSIRTSGSLKKTRSTLTYTGNRNDTQIYCKAQNIHSIESVTSQATQLHVQFAPSAAVVITANPSSPHYVEGTSVTLTCYLAGGNPIASLKWQCKGQKVSGSNQSTTVVAKSSLNLTVDRSYNGQKCICTAIHPLFSSARTDDFTFSVLFSPTALPTITANPSSKPFNDGTSVTLICNLPGGNPVASLIWQCKGQQVSGYNHSTTDVARSSLNLIMDGSYNGQQCICTARHNLFASDRKVDFTFSVLYAPSKDPVILAMPSKQQYTEGTAVNLTCELPEGNPIAALSWECKRRHVAGSDQNLTGIAKSSVTLIVDSTYNSESCVCMANQYLLPNPKSTNFVFSVLYDNKIKSVKFIEGSRTIKEHDRLSLQTDVDGNPKSTVQWDKYDNGSLLQRDMGVSRSVFTIPVANCLDTGPYRVTASNSLGKPAENITNVYVRCSPRLDDRFQNQSSKITAIQSNDSLHITARILSYPSPSKRNIVWTFFSRDTGENRTISNGVDQYYISTYFSMIEQRVYLTKYDMTSSDFGTYILTIRNEEGIFTSNYEVDEAGPPSIPSNFTLNCNKPGAANLSWISEFNGGVKQKFVPQYKSKPDAQFTDYRIGVDDKGLKVTHTETVKEIEGDYWFRIKSLNTFGESFSGIQTCNIKENYISGDSDHLNLGIPFGILFGIFLCVSITLALILFIKTRKKDVQERKSERNTYDELQVIKQDNTYEDIGTPGQPPLAVKPSKGK